MKTTTKHEFPSCRILWFPRFNKLHSPSLPFFSPSNFLLRRNLFVRQKPSKTFFVCVFFKQVRNSIVSHEYSRRKEVAPMCITIEMGPRKLDTFEDIRDCQSTKPEYLPATQKENNLSKKKKHERMSIGKL